MHVYFSGIGGAGISSLALIAKQAGFTVSGSDITDTSTIAHLRDKNVGDIHIGQSYEHIAAVHAKHPIDWFVYTSALPMQQPDAPELRFCHDHGIKATKRDEFLHFLLHEKRLRMIAIAGTHGKTTTTAMAVWLFRQLNIPISYAVAAKISFGDTGHYDPRAEYFVYEADEYDRNFLAFHPGVSIITGVDWDHPDIYPTKEAYHDAFRDFIAQSRQTILWRGDAAKLHITANGRRQVLDETATDIDRRISLPGHVNRLNGWQVAHALQQVTGMPLDELIRHVNRFPGVARRFEQITPNIYSDYAHTPPKIRGALQLAHEVAGDNVVVVYEGLHNTRQHFIRHELKHLFDSVKHLYVVPSYLAREDKTLRLLSPEDLIRLLDTRTQARAQPAALDARLEAQIREHAGRGDVVLCLTAGGGGSLDEWLRQQWNPPDRA